MSISSSKLNPGTTIGVDYAEVTTVPASTSSVVLFTSNLERVQGLIYNNSTSALFLKFGSVVTPSDFSVRIPPKFYYELPIPVFFGEIHGVWDVANGDAKITKFSKIPF